MTQINDMSIAALDLSVSKIRPQNEDDSLQNEDESDNQKITDNDEWEHLRDASSKRKLNESLDSNTDSNNNNTTCEPLSKRRKKKQPSKSLLRDDNNDDDEEDEVENEEHIKQENIDEDDNEEHIKQENIDEDDMKVNGEEAQYDSENEYIGEIGGNEAVAIEHENASVQSRSQSPIGESQIEASIPVPIRYYKTEKFAPTINHKPIAASHVAASNKKQMRFQCKFCEYRSHSVSLMQNHIYRHIDTTPYSCFYCGHKSTTKSTIMVHIELCHPNTDVKIDENRVREEDFYIDLNASHSQIESKLAGNKQSKQLKETDYNTTRNGASNKFEIIDSKCQNRKQSGAENAFASSGKHHEPIKSEMDLVQAHSTKVTNSCASSLSASSSSPVSSRSVTPSSSPIPTAHKKQPEEHDCSDYLNNTDDRHLYMNGINRFNRPKQYYGSLYEPDKQYSCKLCTYTTNHKPSMEDHVYVHTNKRPYRCGYCNEEIYTRYAATYHNKYKHPGEARHFIKDEQDVSKYYVNRAKTDSQNASLNESIISNSTQSSKTQDAKSDKQSQSSKSASATLPLNKVPNDDEQQSSKHSSKKNLKPKELIQQSALGSTPQQTAAFNPGLSQAQIAAALAAFMTPQASATPLSTSPSSSVSSTSPTSSSSHATLTPQYGQANIQQQLLQHLMLNPAANMNANPFYELMKSCFQMQYQNVFAAKLFENHLKQQISLNDADANGSNNCKFSNLPVGSFALNNRASFSDQANSSDVDESSQVAGEHNNDSNENDESSTTHSNSKLKHSLHKNLNQLHQQQASNLANSKKSSKKSVNRN